VVVIVSQRREPADLHASFPGPEHRICVDHDRVAGFLQGSAPVDHFRPASSSGPVVIVEPRDPVQDVSLPRFGAILIGYCCRVPATPFAVHHE